MVCWVDNGRRWGFWGIGRRLQGEDHRNGNNEGPFFPNAFLDRVLLGAMRADPTRSTIVEWMAKSHTSAALRFLPFRYFDLG